jgi:RsiW-degrading membrane proteinase PrsW (M82 family)
MEKAPGGSFIGGTIKLKQLFPIFTMWRSTRSKGFLVPAAMTIVVSTLMGLMLTFPDSFKFQTANGYVNLGVFDCFAWVFGAYIALLFVYLIYSLCGKQKSALVVVAAMVLGVVCLYPVWRVLHFVLSDGLAVFLFPDKDHLGLLGQFLDNVVSIGMVEEGTKLVPVLLLCLIALKFKSPWREQMLVREPLDGILLGAASGAGFALFETIHQYMRDALLDDATPQAWSQFMLFMRLRMPELSTLTNRQLYSFCRDLLTSRFSMQDIMDLLHVNGFSPMAELIVRSLNDLAGHMAWAAILGYAFGIMMLKPRKNWIALPIGYLLVSSLHAVWDLRLVGELEGLGLQTLLSGLLSYALLATAILQARQVSPTRAFNFATELLQIRPRPVTAQVRTVQPAVAQPTSRLVLVMGTRSLSLQPGTTLRQQEIPGLRASAADTLVAEVRPIPGDSAMLGLKNLSTSNWQADTPDGQRRQLSPGRILRIARGVRIDFGGVRGQIQ